MLVGLVIFGILSGYLATVLTNVTMVHTGDDVLLYGTEVSEVNLLLLLLLLGKCSSTGSWTPSRALVCLTGAREFEFLSWATKPEIYK